MPVPSMSRARTQIRMALGAAVAVLVAGGVCALAGLPLAWTILVVAAAAAGAAATMVPAAAPAPVIVEAPPAPAPPAASLDEEETRWRKLRHDLRGILSPALLMADRLLMSTEDPLARRTAEAMIDAVERAEKRISGKPAS